MSPWVRRDRSFSWRRDFRRVQWGATTRVNILRAFAAGLVWMVVATIASVRQTGGSTLLHWWTIPFITGLGYIGLVMLFLPVAKLLTAFGGDAGKTGVNVLTFIGGLLVAVGDPLVFMVQRKWPNLVPAERFRPFNAALVVFVVDSAAMTYRWRYR